MCISQNASDGRFVGFARINAVDSLARQLVQNIGLPFPRHRAVAYESRQDLLVTEVLAPGLELLGRLAKLLSQCRQRLAEAMRIEIWEIRQFKRFLKNPPYRGRIAPTHPIEVDSCKKALFPDSDSSRRKQGSSGPNKLSLVKNEIQSTTIASISLPTGKKVDVNVLRFLVRTSRAS